MRRRRQTAVEVQVGDPQAGDLTAPGASVQQEGDHGGVPTCLEALTGAGGAASSRRKASSGTTGMGLSGTTGGFMRAIGLTAISSSSSSQRYSACGCL
jgi:hypothetical protein